jgi:hypothetical protein
MEGVPPKATDPPHEVRAVDHTAMPFFVGMLMLVAEGIYVALREGKTLLHELPMAVAVAYFGVVLCHDWASGKRRYKFRFIDIVSMTTVILATIVFGNWFDFGTDVQVIVVLEWLAGVGIVYWLRGR